MSREIREKLMTIIDIASVDYECSDKQKAKIKYLAKDIMLNLDFNPTADDNPSKQKALVVRLLHIVDEIKSTVYKRNEKIKQGRVGSSYLLSDWCGLYNKYLELISRITIEYEEQDLTSMFVPTFSDFEEWKNESKRSKI